ncbi:protein PLANT CADMIUM RESISTANCE 2-like isoform X2 [Tasmannia lanceolata]|uniref:protein PLANT CADMIUM RESISTANCE 2-like isoform X2 n=1 Tax=Tasmannia lanceolata TaxID=3420 RepID=UPI004063ECA0
MYSHDTYDYQKYPSSSPPTAPPMPTQFGDHPSLSTGIPANLPNQFYPPNQFYQMNTPVAPQSQAPARWSTGLCGCCDDIDNCCVTCCCPCITFGQISEILDKGSHSCVRNGTLYTILLCFTGCACLYSCFYRSKLRRQYFLEESPCMDCFVHFCCEPCALCQEYRELKKRGLDMSIGWKGNLERKNGGVTLPPTIVGGMSR